MLMSLGACKIRNIAPVCTGAMLRGVMFCIVFCIIIQLFVFLFPANIQERNSFVKKKYKQNKKRQRTKEK